MTPTQREEGCERHRNRGSGLGDGGGEGRLQVGLKDALPSVVVLRQLSEIQKIYGAVTVEVALLPLERSACVVVLRQRREVEEIDRPVGVGVAICEGDEHEAVLRAAARAGADDRAAVVDAAGAAEHPIGGL